MKRYNLTTYKTFTGVKKVLELQEKKRTEAVVYKDNKPSYHVDCFDLKNESNLIMNGLVLGQKKSIAQVIKAIGKKNNVNLSVKEGPLLFVKKTVEVTEESLPPLPESWLN